MSHQPNPQSGFGRSAGEYARFVVYPRSTGLPQRTRQLVQVDPGSPEYRFAVPPAYDFLERGVLPL